jgi:hypothetical protein
MHIEFQDNEIEAATDEEFAAKYAAVLMQALYETSAETQISVCFLSDVLVKTTILNMQKNGHGGCAAEVLRGASSVLAELEQSDAKEQRH